MMEKTFFFDEKQRIYIPDQQNWNELKLLFLDQLKWRGKLNSENLFVEPYPPKHTSDWLQYNPVFYFSGTAKQRIGYYDKNFTSVLSLSEGRSVHLSF